MNSQLVLVSARHPEHSFVVLHIHDLTSFVHASPDTPVFIHNESGETLGQVHKADLTELLIQHVETT